MFIDVIMEFRCEKYWPFLCLSVQIRVQKMILKWLQHVDIK
jgi:hypothetical protein